MKTIPDLVTNYTTSNPNNFPDGEFIDDTGPGTYDGSELVKDWPNELLEGAYSLIRSTETEPNGIAETPGNGTSTYPMRSQIAEAAKALSYAGAQISSFANYSLILDQTATTMTITSIASHDGVIIAVGDNGSGNERIIRSIDGGYTWVDVSPTTSMTTLVKVHYSEVLNKFVILGPASIATFYAFLTSTDGVTWALLPWSATGPGTSLVDFADNGVDLFVIVGTNGNIWTTPDLVTFTERVASTGSAADNLSGIIYSPELDQFLTCGATGRILTGSADGITWTPQTNDGGVTGEFFDVAWCARISLYTVIGDSFELQTSPDGVNWTAQNATSRGSIYPERIIATKYGFFAVGSIVEGDLYRGYSTNGVDWYEVTIPSTVTAITDFIDVTYDELRGCFVCAGNGKDFMIGLRNPHPYNVL